MPPRLPDPELERIVEIESTLTGIDLEAGERILQYCLARLRSRIRSVAVQMAQQSTLASTPTHELYQKAFPEGCDASGSYVPLKE